MMLDDCFGLGIDGQGGLVAPLFALVLRAWCFVESLGLFLRFAALPRPHRWGWWR